MFVIINTLYACTFRSDLDHLFLAMSSCDLYNSKTTVFFEYCFYKSERNGELEVDCATDIQNLRYIDWMSFGRLQFGPAAT